MNRQCLSQFLRARVFITTLNVGVQLDSTRTPSLLEPTLKFKVNTNAKPGPHECHACWDPRRRLHIMLVFVCTKKDVQAKTHGGKRGQAPRQKKRQQWHKPTQCRSIMHTCAISTLRALSRAVVLDGVGLRLYELGQACRETGVKMAGNWRGIGGELRRK